KIEAIPGFKTSLTLEQFQNALDDFNFVMIGQTPELAPADKKLYALRDVTATVESIPLITGSIMSKKLAEGANGLVFDIKCGSGAFMKNFEDAKKLGQSLMNTAGRFQKNSYMVISNMDQPLGQAIGNANEIIESLETLQGKGPEDLTQLSLELAAAMVLIAGKATDKAQADEKVREALDSGAAYQIFKEFIRRQGGDIRYLEDTSLFDLAKVDTVVSSKSAGTICAIDSQSIGNHIVSLGGGRKISSDSIDHSVGITLHCKIGDQIAIGDKFLTIHHHADQKELAVAINDEIIATNIVLTKDPVEKVPLIFETECQWSSH
ncbi:MAG: thymidine phosphorylase, partial [Halobacteriovoraceae bacterium]|nr:thymidine phosphorylase [Halobacteriovoraceae bacterium]